MVDNQSLATKANLQSHETQEVMKTILSSSRDQVELKNLGYDSVDEVIDIFFEVMGIDRNKISPSEYSCIIRILAELARYVNLRSEIKNAKNSDLEDSLGVIIRESARLFAIHKQNLEVSKEIVVSKE